MNLFESASSSKVTLILKMVALFRGVSMEKLLQEIQKRGGDVVTRESVYRRSSFSSAFRTALAGLVSELPTHKRLCIEVEIEDRASVIDKPEDMILGGRILKSLQSWLSLEAGSQRGFLERNAGDRGHYLLFRCRDATRISVSQLTIFRPEHSHLLPTYQSEQIRPGSNDSQIVNGTIFQSGETVYAIGQIRNSYELRFSRLIYVGRKDFRDLYGIRTGHSELTRSSYAYLIYALQIPKEAVQSYRRILSVTSPEDPLLEQIDGARSGIDLVLPARGRPNQLQLPTITL